jgi:hypothetical protein
MTREKVLIDQASLTFADLADIEEQLGVSLSDLFEKSQARGMAALVWVTVRRTNPDFTFAEAMAYGPTDIETVDDTDPEVPGVSDGATPRRLGVSGVSTLQKSS